MQKISDKPIYVTSPSLAPLPELFGLLEGVWERGILTHNGPLVQQFEKDFSQTFNIPSMVAVTNGTVAIQMAVKALDLKGEIITTPFTWVATVSAIKWEQCTPVFVDIDPHTLNMDAKKIEEKISKDTVAIMPVHVFGNACDCEAIETIARKHNLKVIYDAAHAVGTQYCGSSVLTRGDISATSFHATKLLNTAEGGGCISLDPALHEKLKRIRFFGHNDQKDIVEDGFNGKMTEVHAAIGIANLRTIGEVLKDRKEKYLLYRSLLVINKDITFQLVINDTSNYSYFPVIFPDEKAMMNVDKALQLQNVFARRYFYPSVNTYTAIVRAEHMPNSEDIASRILCLPLYRNLTMDQVCQISELILKSI